MAIIRELNLGRIWVKDEFYRKLYDENNSRELLENVIQNVSWTCKLIDEETGLFEETSGVCIFQYPEAEFIPYDELNKSTILSWLENNSSIEYKFSKIKSRLESRIDEYKKNKYPKITSFDSFPD